MNHWLQALKNLLQKRLFAFSLLILALLPVLYAARFSHPSNDDFDNAVWIDYAAKQVQLYREWTGRYFSSLLCTFTPLHWHAFGMYRLCAILVLAGFAALFYYTCNRLLIRLASLSATRRRLIAALSVIIFFNDAPSLEEGFYWYTGAVTYTLPAMMLLLFLLLAWKLDAQVAVSRHPGWILPAQLALVVAVQGSNESTIPLTLACCLGLSVYYRHKRQSQLFRHYSLLLLTGVIAAIVALLAPGNSVRQAQIPRSVIIAIPSWVYFSKDLFIEWIKEPVFLVYSLLVLSMMRTIRLKSMLPLWLCFLLPLLVSALLLLPGYYALGRMPPYRVRNIAYIFFIPLWLHFLAQLACRLRQMFSGIRSGVQWRQLSAIALMMVALSGLSVDGLRASSNYFLLARGFGAGIFKAYDLEMRQRYHAVAASTEDTVVVPPIRNQRGNLLYFADLNTNPDVFPNVTYAAFWGKKKIRTDSCKH